MTTFAEELKETARVARINAQMQAQERRQKELSLELVNMRARWPKLHDQLALRAGRGFYNFSWLYHEGISLETARRFLEPRGLLVNTDENNIIMVSWEK